MGRAAKGRSIANLLELKAGETIAALIRVLSKTNANKEDVTWEQPGFLFFATKQGTVKKTALEDFANVRKGGIIAIGIEPGDTLIDVKADDRPERGRAHHPRRHEHPLQRGGRASDGPARRRRARHQFGQRRRVVALAVVVPDAKLLVAGENGIGKRTDFEEYRQFNRAAAKASSP